MVIVGSTLSAISYLVLLLPGLLSTRVRLSFFLAAVLTGMVLWILAGERLKRQYRAGLWSEEELASTRALLARPIWVWMTGTILVAGILVALVTKHQATLIYLTIVPLNAISSMKTALAPPKQKTGGLVDWKNFKPIHSDHWGEPPRGSIEAALGAIGSMKP